MSSSTIYFLVFAVVQVVFWLKVISNLQKNGYTDFNRNFFKIIQLSIHLIKTIQDRKLKINYFLDFALAVLATLLMIYFAFEP